MPGHTLVGTWNLVSYTVTNEDGVKIAEPFGPSPRGLLIYTDNGFMSGQLMSASRPQWRSDRPRKASTEEKVLAFDTYLSYCGTYEQHGEHVIHHVMTSLIPNWIGTDQIRLIQLEGDLLTLSVPPVLGKGKTRTVQLTWRRLEIPPEDLA
jgi:Lipocalin-like domain